jgi:hypothetical protein
MQRAKQLRAISPNSLKEGLSLRIFSQRQEAVKWGLFVTMVVFVITLKDRLAEVLAAASFLIGLLVNAPIFSHIPNTAE